MATTEGLRRQRRGGGPAHVTGSGSGRPLARRLLGLFWCTRGALVVGLALSCAGLEGVAGAATITEFPIPTPNSGPVGITAGPDGALWFTEAGTGKIGRITTAGTLTEFPIPTPNSGPVGITAGPDGALWFTEFGCFFPPCPASKIGRITTAGAITEFAAGSRLQGITAGPDGALWFTEAGTGKIGRITTAGTLTEFAVPLQQIGRGG
jgi:virginiamycin B lyase